MKSLLVVLASLFIGHQPAYAAETRALEITDSFSDLIHWIEEEKDTLIVAFKKHTALYKISKEHPQYSEIKAKIEKAQKSDKKLKVVAIIPSMSIKEIKE